MKKIIAYLSISVICTACMRTYAADGNPANATVLTVRSPNPYTMKYNGIVKTTLPQNSDIRSQFLFPINEQQDPLKSMTLRSAAAGAGILGAIMGGRIAAKLWINPHLCFAPGIDIGSKRADFTLTF